MAGADFEYIEAEVADVVLITSADEAIVKQIWEFGERNRTELAKWKAEQESKK